MGIRFDIPHESRRLQERSKALKTAQVAAVNSM
jgi:hypothetical protein